jgi:hypothetical protein
MELYADGKLYPYGPPSSFTREVIDDPDRPVRTWITNRIFWTPSTGLYLIIAGCVIQIAAVWTA